MRTWLVLIRNSYKQSFRAPVRLIGSFLIIALICAFLCVSLDLRQNAKANLHILQQQFQVVAVPTFKGSVDTSGKLTTEIGANYAGFLEVSAQNFDLSLLKNATGVRDVLVHRQYGAYLQSEKTLLRISPIKDEYRDVFIFTYTGDTPKTVRWVAGTEDATRAGITLDWSAIGMEQYPFRTTGSGFCLQNTLSKHILQSRWSALLPDLGLDAMWPKDGRGERTGDFVLQPGQQYIACGKWLVGGTSSQIKVTSVSFGVDQGHCKITPTYTNDRYFQGWQTVSDEAAYQVTYPCIMPYTQDFWNTEAGAYYRDAIDLCQINQNTLTVVTTADLSLYKPFYSGGVYVSQGRSFTEEDYTGRRVCLVSQHLAELNGWQIGDFLDLSLFESVYAHNGQASDVRSYYQPLTEVWNPDTETYTLTVEDSFFHQSKYEIVGFYDGKVTKSNWLTEPQYNKNEGIDRQVVILPEASVASLPSVPLSQYNTTVLLDDEQVLAFMSDMEASGLLEQRKGSYQTEFAVHDQGLSGIKQSLRQLNRVSRLTLGLSCAAAGAAVILLSALLYLQARKEIAALRALGVRRKQIPLAVLSGILLICLLAACFGGLAGHLISGQTTALILNTAQSDWGDLSFSTILSSETGNVWDTLALQSRWANALFAAGAVWGALCLLSALLVTVEAGNAPMRRLGTKE